MMAATEIPLFYTDQQSHAASFYFSPASTIVSDSSVSWNMAPRTEQDSDGEHTNLLTLIVRMSRSYFFISTIQWTLLLQLRYACRINSGYLRHFSSHMFRSISASH